MKTPWGFVAKLVSRKPTADRVASQTPPADVEGTEFLPTRDEAVTEVPVPEVGDDSAISASDAKEPIEGRTSDYALEESSAQNDMHEKRLPASDDGSDVQRSDEVIVDVSDTAARDGMVAVEFVAADPATVEISQEGQSQGGMITPKPSEVEAARELSQKSKRRKRVPRKLEEKTVVHGTARIKTPSTPRSESDEISELDLEIQELRARLAEKLRTQNRQLNLMLRRFDVS